MALSHGYGNSLWSYLKPWMKGSMIGTALVLVVLCAHILLFGATQSIIPIFFVSLVILPIVGGVIGNRKFRDRYEN